MGPGVEPWGTPDVLSRKWDRPPSNLLTACARPDRYEKIHFIALSEKFSSLSFRSNRVWSMESKARFKSNNNKTVTNPSFTPRRISSAILSSAVWVLRLFRKPDWKGDINEFDSKYSVNCWVMMKSKTLAKWGRFATGLVSEVEVGVALLLRWTIIDCFHCLGYVVVEIDWLNKSVKNGAIIDKFQLKYERD